MTTINAVGNGLSGSTGSGNFVGATSPTLTTPTIGAATATSITFSPTTSGIVGTTTNDNAAAGKVGEVISSFVGAPGNSISTSTDTNLTSISLTAGDWDVYGNVSILNAGTLTKAICWTSTTSASAPAADSYAGLISTSIGGGGAACINAPHARYSLSGTTTIYLSCNAAFSSTATMCGSLFARRAR